MQRYITKSLPQSEEQFKSRWNSVIKHYNIFTRLSDKPVEDANCYEFGAGWDLMFPLSFSALGFSNIYCVDIRPLAMTSLINSNINFINKHLELTKQSCIKIEDYSGKELSSHNMIKKLAEKFHIYYYAPMDARKTNIPDASIDFFYSNATLEHIPSAIIVPILKECYRILNSEGIFSVMIDYSDHWSSFDRSITQYNYLKFSSKEWLKYNPSLQYQNRLRHSDYIRFFEQSGFEILSEEKFYPDQKQIDQLKTLPLANEFKKYTFDDLTITGCWITGKKKNL
ncbi:MAG: class I SAM-dependent methyltransferase [Planctomycetaceae bacterium]|jgi:ubiquinone/menaquinone biosynthesis C-methylase UbiE|nr:class I SAM-dependent methyltransferase [Planctomycetaceae bacterium]